MEVLVYLHNRLLAACLAEQLRREVPECYPHPLSGWPPAVASAPAIVILDPHGCRAEVFAAWPQAACLLLDTGLSAQKLSYLLMAFPIRGLLAAEMEPRQLGRALRAVLRNEVWLDHGTTRSVLEQVRGHRPSAALQHLTPQEICIAERVAQGKRNREIAEELCICERTVKNHLGHIFRKLEVSSRTQLTRLILSHLNPA